MDFLKSAVASAIAKGPLAGYIVGEKVELEESYWTLNQATKREDSSRCSIFTFDLATRRSQVPLARNAFRKFRTLRHPGVLRVLETLETDAQICIITERVAPLARQLRRDSLTEEALKWGLWNMAKTVAFINNEAASVHACLRLSSLFMAESGEWKLGGLDVLSSIAEDEAMVHTHTGLLPNYNRLLTPEVAKSGWGVYKQNPWPAVDSWGFANLITEVFGGPFTGPVQPSELKNLPPSMSQQYKRLLNANPKGRLAVAGFFEQGRKPGGYFRTPLIAVTESLDSLGLKGDGEREEFLDELHDVATQFPEEFLKHRILPEMLKSVEFGGGGAKVFAVVLQISSKLSEDDYEKQVLPVIVRLFASPDRALRVCLLDSLPSMIERIPKSIINDKIFPNITTGFSDMAPLVREQTVKSVLTIINKLSDRTVNGELLKHLAKTANDTEPGIRTNTTICLGKVARYLGPNTRTKVLVAAFTRALKDPFVHARNAAIMALGATVEMFSEEDCASKILPALCPSLLDKEKIVRDQSSKTVDQYLQRIRKEAQAMPESALPAPSSGATPAVNGAPRVGTTASDSSWAGWAISSFTNKLSTADGDIQQNAKANVNGGPHSSLGGASAPASRPSSTAPPFGRPSTASHQPTLSRQTTDTSRIAQSFVKPELATQNDGWGDVQDDAWGAMDDEVDESWDNEPVQPSTATTSNRSSIAAPTATTKASSTSQNGDSEPDFAGWLKAQQASKTKKGPLPKGLGSKTPGPSARTDATGTKSTTVAAPSNGHVPVKPTTTKQPADDEEDWGDAWG